MLDLSTSSLKDIRQSLGKTQKELAEMLGYSRNYIAIIESGPDEKFPDKLRDRLKSIVELSTTNEEMAAYRINNTQHQCDNCDLKQLENDQLKVRLKQSCAIIEAQAKSIENLTDVLSRINTSPNGNVAPVSGAGIGGTGLNNTKKKAAQ